MTARKLTMRDYNAALELVLDAHEMWAVSGQHKKRKGRQLDLSGAFLAQANLTDADLMWAYLTGANLQGAKLEGSVLAYANLEGSDLEGAKLKDADLRLADLRGANLKGVKGL